MPSHVWSNQFKSGSGSATSVAETVTADSEVVLDRSIPASTTDGQANISIDVSAVKSLMIYSDKAVTIKTNSSSVPDQTFTLTAKQMILWRDGDQFDNPLTDDVTALYITNASSTDAATVKVYALVDATPVLAG